MAMHKVKIPTLLRNKNTYFAQCHSRMVPAQSRNMDQVTIVVILFYPLLGQRLNLILNRVDACLTAALNDK